MRTTRLGFSGASAIKQKNEKAKSFQIKPEKDQDLIIDIPRDAKFQGMPIRRSMRIPSLCGFEFGEILQSSKNGIFDKDGNVIFRGKLEKPFRLCTHYEIKYSRINKALYSIGIYSMPQAKMDEKTAIEELNLMHDIIKKKFKSQISTWQKMGKSIYSSMDIFAYQRFRIDLYKSKFNRRDVLKGTHDPRPKEGWAFSILLVDTLMQRYKPEEQKKENKDLNGIDAL